MKQYHVGIDLHKSLAQVCVLDAKGRIVEEKRFLVPDAVRDRNWSPGWPDIGRVDASR